MTDNISARMEMAISWGVSAPILIPAGPYSLSKKSSECTGNFFIDEYLLHESGERDFDKYAVKQGSKLFQDLYLDWYIYLVMMM